MCWHCFAPQSPGGIFSIGGTRSDAKRLASWHFTSGQSHCGCRAVAGQVGGRRDYAKTRTQVATSQRQLRLREDAAQTRNVAASQRRSVRRDKGRRNYAKTRTQVGNVAASDATTRRRCPNSQRRSVAASQRQTRQRQMQLREDANTSRNVAASDDTTRRRSNIGSDPS